MMGFPAGRTATVFAEVFAVLLDCLAVNYSFGLRYASRTTSPRKKEKARNLTKGAGLSLACLRHCWFGYS